MTKLLLKNINDEPIRKIIDKVIIWIMICRKDFGVFLRNVNSINVISTIILKDKITRNHQIEVAARKKAS